MALKRINKELTDLGRYVDPLSSSAPADLAVCSHDSLRMRGLEHGDGATILRYNPGTFG